MPADVPNPAAEPPGKTIDRRQAIGRALVTSMTVSLASPCLASVSAAAVSPEDLAARPVASRRRTADTRLKRRARKDYRSSLARFGGRFSNNVDNLFADAMDSDRIHFGVAVIGSGYGASICAARLSQRLRDSYRICILERGREWVPGSFPDRFADLVREARTMIAGPKKGQMVNPLGLFDIMMNEEINLLMGNGLGGGSLINASIALRPHHEVFQQTRWPAALRDVAVLDPYYKMVARQMSLTQTPIDQTPKSRVRRRAGERISTEPGFFDLSNVSVMYDYRYLDEHLRNPQGMIQRPCTLCGDCTTGCNVGAKNTLLMNYLPVAKWNGTEMYTQCEVQRIEKRRGYYRLHLVYYDDSEPELKRRKLAINSRMVVIGAGSPNSAAILLQSQDDQFQFSSALGCHWSGNGDTIGFVIDMPSGTNIGGYGAYEPKCREPVGPTIQTCLNYYSSHELFRRLLVQDAAIPRGANNLFRVLLGDRDLNHSMVMLAMGHDGAQGRMVWKNGRWQISWPGLKESRYRKMVFSEFERLAAAHGGQYKRLKAFGGNLVSVHPLGGCGMSDDPANGPINHLGQVYDGMCGGYRNSVTGLPEVHRGLYVADGSVMPTAVGVNPYMTIGALAERIANHIVSNPQHEDLFEIRRPSRNRRSSSVRVPLSAAADRKLTGQGTIPKRTRR